MFMACVVLAFSFSGKFLLLLLLLFSGCRFLLAGCLRPGPDGPDEAQQEFITAWQMMPGDIYNPGYVADFIHNNTALPHLRTYAGTFRAEADPQTHLVNLTVTFFPSNGR